MNFLPPMNVAIIAMVSCLKAEIKKKTAVFYFALTG